MRKLKRLTTLIMALIMASPITFTLTPIAHAEDNEINPVDIQVFGLTWDRSYTSKYESAFGLSLID